MSFEPDLTPKSYANCKDERIDGSFGAYNEELTNLLPNKATAISGCNNTPNHPLSPNQPSKFMERCTGNYFPEYQELYQQESNLQKNLSYAYTSSTQIDTCDSFLQILESESHTLFEVEELNPEAYNHQQPTSDQKMPQSTSNKLTSQTISSTKQNVFTAVYGGSEVQSNSSHSAFHEFEEQMISSLSSLTGKMGEVLIQ